MINLYQLLDLPHYADSRAIQAALQRKQDGLDAKVVKAVNEWLLVPEVRARYDAKLRQEQPDFFMPAHDLSRQAAADKPKIVPLTDETADDDDYIDLPPLWNPKAAMYWSIFFNVVFGAVLHAKNWEALDERELAKQNWIFAAVGAAVLFALMLTDSTSTLGLQIGLVIAWYYSLGKKQVAFFEQEFNNEYERKGWILPIVLTLLALIVLAVAAVFVSALFFPNER